jgi:hypothetical protein
MKHRSSFLAKSFQEFWNNAIGAIETLSGSLQRKYESLSDEVRKVQVNFPTLYQPLQTLLDEFSATYGVIYEPGTATRITTLLNAVQSVAMVPYVPRTRFYSIALVRDQTRTPPGFKDTRHGDFYVWADFLCGLADAQTRAPFSRCVMVTEDAKVDWSRGGRAHPILTAEVDAMIQVPFAVWSVTQLAAYVDDRTRVT